MSEFLLDCEKFSAAVALLAGALWRGHVATGSPAPCRAAPLGLAMFQANSFRFRLVLTRLCAPVSSLKPPSWPVSFWGRLVGLVARGLRYFFVGF